VGFASTYVLASIVVPPANVVLGVVLVLPIFKCLHLLDRRRSLDLMPQKTFALRRRSHGIDDGSGSRFRESLAAVAFENRDHPLGQEFGKVHLCSRKRQTLRQALVEMRDRLTRDETKWSFPSSAEELGTPLGKSF